MTMTCCDHLFLLLLGSGLVMDNLLYYPHKYIVSRCGHEALRISLFSIGSSSFIRIYNHNDMHGQMLNLLQVLNTLLWFQSSIFYDISNVCLFGFRHFLTYLITPTMTFNMMSNSSLFVSSDHRYNNLTCTLFCYPKCHLPDTSLNVTSNNGCLFVCSLFWGTTKLPKFKITCYMHIKTQIYFQLM